LLKSKLIRLRPKPFRMTTQVARGALIVLEGGDKSGKSTQCRKLVENLMTKGIQAELWRYPERSTAIGKVISDYLEKKIELEDHAIHLLFSANRWEFVPKMKTLLAKGVTLVIDRYAFSGAAFTGAKAGFCLDWCRSADVGLPAPDAVFYLTLNPDVAATRGDFGGERYEDTDFQKIVETNFSRLRDHSWRVVDASRTIEVIESDLLQQAVSVIKSSQFKPMSNLWTEWETGKKTGRNDSEILKENNSADR